jgi:hypothetical protein
MTGHPAVDAIADRARSYREASLINDGVPPEFFVVTAEEYACLAWWYRWFGRRDAVGQGTAIRLYGMQVVVEIPVSPRVRQWIHELAEAMKRGAPLSPEPQARVDAYRAQMSQETSESLDSDQSSMDEWARGVHAMIAEVRRRRDP